MPDIYLLNDKRFLYALLTFLALMFPASSLYAQQDNNERLIEVKTSGDYFWG
jgi:hypothetical protein